MSLLSLKSRALAGVAVGFLLAACGGGGGDPGGGVVTPPPPPAGFANWSTSLRPGATVTTPGKANEIGFNQVPGSPALTAVASGDKDMVRTLGPAGETVGVQIGGPAHGASFATANGDTIAAEAGYRVRARSQDGDRTAVFIEPAQKGWDYQTVGVWQSKTTTVEAGLTYWAGAVSTGAATPVSGMKTTGTATFNGTALVYAAASGNGSAAGEAPATFNVDFAARTVNFATAAFRKIDDAALTFVPAVGLIGRMTYDASANALTGTMRTVGNSRASQTGPVTGRFYGPNGEELGGLFSVPLIAETLVGAFGASSTPRAGTPVVRSGLGQYYQASSSVFGSSVERPRAAEDAILTETRDASGTVTRLEMLTGLDLTYPSGGTPTFTPTSDGASLLYGSAGTTPSAMLADAQKQGWNYQSFGVWGVAATRLGGGGGGVSGGTATAGAALQTTGTATFRGKAGAAYGAYSPVMAQADITINADFAARTAAVATGGFSNAQTGAAIANTAFTGSMTYAAGTNALAGTAQTADGRLTGSISGQFFGPAAQEIGGVFGLAGAAGSANADERLVGAFGARR